MSSLQKGRDVVLASQIDIRSPNLVKLGNHVAIDSYFCCTTRLEVGDYVHIAPHVSVIGGQNGFLKMGHFTNLAAGCRVICVSDNFVGDGLIGVAPALPPAFRDKTTAAPVVIEDLANIGTNVTIFPGVTIKQGAVIGAGAIVKKSTKPWTIYVGSPARPIRRRPSDQMMGFAAKLGYSFVLKN